ncbi:MAG: hypothetical protein P4L55_08325 [Syntrophobacteraceae bacterium]|nr:hypothetical protein [Syntrophobacteraceae bacterium]
MKEGKTGSRLLSFALCALIALLVLKLGLTVADALRGAPVVSVAVPAAMAKEERPQPKHVSILGPESAAAAPGAMASVDFKSMSSLQQEASQIHRQQEQLREEEQQLKKLKKEVEEKISTLLALQKQYMLAQGQKKSALNSQVQGLARIYGTMKPKQAAKLMGSLEDSLVKSIISTMPPDKAASILALMDVKKAAKISEALSGQ